MDRWWAPEEPAVGISASDLVLLQPGEDPTYDLGGALFAVHRVGAAACQVVADTPMASEMTLVQTLALARESYAPPVVECIAKSLGDSRYAGLLVRDVADAAELGALDLYRSAVAKGVAPPLAAQRVGMVYGVPSDRMGAFKGLACSPAANPVALQDAADRALFAYVEALAQEEIEQSKINSEVAKADTLTRQEFQLLHPQSTTTGRFVPKQGSMLERLKARQAAKPEVQSEVRPATKSVQRTRRTQRTVRSEAKTEATPQAQLVVQPLAIQRLAASMRPSRAEINRLTGKPAGPPPDKDFDPMKSHGEDSSAYPGLHMDFNESLSFVLDPGQLQEVVKKTGQFGGRFRIGNLQEYAGTPEFSVDGKGPKDPLNSGSANKLAYHPQTIANKADQDFEPPTFIHIPDTMDTDEAQAIMGDIGMTQDDVIRARVAQKYLAGTDLQPGTPEYEEEFRHVAGRVRSFRDRHDTGDYFVYAPTPLQTLNEVRITGSMRGYVEGTKNSREVTLAPDQIVGFTGNASDSYFDEHSGGFVTVWDARMVPDTSGDDPYAFGKADLMTRQEFQLLHPQSQTTGRFVPKHDSMVERLKAKQAVQLKPTQRTARTQRTQRTVRPVELKPVERLAVQQAKPLNAVQMDTSLRLALQRLKSPTGPEQAKAGRGVPDDKLPPVLHVVDASEMEDFLDRSTPSAFSGMRTSVVLDSEDVNTLFGPRANGPYGRTVDQATQEVREHVTSYAEHHRTTRGEEWLTSPEGDVEFDPFDEAPRNSKPYLVDINSPQSMNDLYRAISNEFAKDDSVVSVTIHQIASNQEYRKGVYEVELYGAKTTKRPAVIKDEVADHTEPVVLEHRPSSTPLPKDHMPTAADRDMAQDLQLATGKNPSLNMVTFVRPAHTYWVARNIQDISGHKTDEAG